MRRLALLFAAAVIVAWAAPASADDDLVMSRKVFRVTVSDNHYNGIDEGYLFFWRYKPSENEAFKNELICLWFGKGIFYNGEWDERHYPPPWSDFVQWDGLYRDYPSPYDDFTGYYHKPGDFVYGWVEPRDDPYTDFFFIGDRLR